MTKKKSNDSLELITTMSFFKQLIAVPIIQKIILYGSRARGDYHERSDIDLAVICPDATAEDWSLILDIIDDADTLLSIDCVRYDDLLETNPLKKEIDKDAVVLFER